MNRKKTGVPELTPQRWAYLKQDLLAVKGTNRYMHVSCEARMIEHPRSHVMVPYIGPGITYRRAA